MNLASILAVAIGGAIGSVMRYAVGFAFLQRFGPGFPWGTAVINVTGSFAIGIVAEIATTRAIGMSPFLRLLLMTGILGGYTTFSTFSLDTTTLFGERAQMLAIAYALGSVVVGILAAYAGIILARALAVHA